jgi:hypothetical protein
MGGLAQTRSLICLWVTLISLPFVSPSGVAAGGEDGPRIPCFVMGQVVSAPHNPFTSLFLQDPLFTYGLFPLPTNIGVTDKRKLDRVYYPRTEKVLTSTYDVIVFYDARVDYWTPRQFQDIDHAFREAGMVSVTVHSVSWSVWEPTILYDLSPISDYDSRYHMPWRMRFRREREPVFLPFAELGLEEAAGSAYAILSVKEGATIWADMLPHNTPWLVCWKPGGGNAGMQWVFGDKFDRGWWGVVPEHLDANRYSLDFATNLLLHSLDKPLIVDVLARREARRMLSVFRSRKLLVLSMLDWAERFGANTLPLSQGLVELEEEAEGAVRLYLGQDYAGAISFIEELDSRVSSLSVEAGRIKDQALFWVFFSEWLAVTGVSLVTAFVLWSLMVKRRMFKPVEGTRFKRDAYL